MKLFSDQNGELQVPKNLKQINCQVLGKQMGFRDDELSFFKVRQIHHQVRFHI